MKVVWASLLIALLLGCGAQETKHGINSDALTMQECRARLAMPKNRRPPADDPTIDKDAICVNMLGARPPGKSSPPTPAGASAPR